MDKSNQEVKSSSQFMTFIPKQLKDVKNGKNSKQRQRKTLSKVVLGNPITETRDKTEIY